MSTLQTVGIPGFTLPSDDLTPLARERWWAERIAALAGLPPRCVQLAMHRRDLRRIPPLRNTAADAASIVAACLELHEAGMSVEEAWATPVTRWTRSKILRRWWALRERTGRPRTLRTELRAGHLSRCAHELLSLAARHVLPPLHDEEELCFDGNWPEGIRRACMPAPAGMQPGDTLWVELDSGVHLQVEVCTDHQYAAKAPAWSDPADPSPLGTRLTGQVAELRAADAWGDEYRAWSSCFPELVSPGTLAAEVPHARSKRFRATLSRSERWGLYLLHLRGLPLLVLDDLRLVAAEHRDAREGRHVGMFHRHRLLRPLAPRLTKKARQLHRDITERKSSPDHLTAAERLRRAAAPSPTLAPTPTSGGSS